MRGIIPFFTVLLVYFTVIAADVSAANGRNISVKQTVSAQTAYDDGFTKQVMREGDGAVRLWNHLLIEDDGPGAGTSNKGAFTEAVYGDRIIKKVLAVEEPRCEKATVVFFTYNWGDPKKAPLEVTVNGRKTTFKYQTSEQYGYVPIEPSWLRKGDNEITFACPEAKDPVSGYVFLISRADEYVAGGSDPAALGEPAKTGAEGGISLLVKGRDEIRPIETKAKGIGSRSLISTNGGKTWAVTGKGLDPAGVKGVPTSLFQTDDVTAIYDNGPDRDKGGVVGEYTARLNLQQYVTEGTLISPVIDLWSEPDKPAALIPFTEVGRLVFSFKGSAPQGTGIVWQIRAGLSMDPLSEKDWSAWTTVAQGASATCEAKGRISMPASHWDPERSVTLPKVRYIQWRAVLSSTDPLKTPVVESVSVDRDITRRMEVPANIFVRSYHNPDIRFSSTGFTYQSAEEPYNKEIVDRDDLDKIVKDSTGEFDAIVKMLDYASRRWLWGEPFVEYPKWNTVDIAERANSVGRGGMCIQFAAYLAHMLTVMGFQARHVNIIGHEVVEVWSNDFEKWIYLDPTQGVNVYQYYTDTGIPLSVCDMHKAYYQLYGVKTPIDWTKPPSAWRTLPGDPKTMPISFSTTDPRIELSHIGWGGYYTNAEFIRMMPRNDFSTTTIPEPLQQGSLQWPWDGYLNWYDRLAPPKLQYSWHTDREADFWPTLNQVHFEAVPEINGNLIFITMSTFTPSFKTFQVRVDDSPWQDSDFRFNWNLHSGKNRLEMRAVSKFGVAGHASDIEVNYVVKHIPKAVPIGSMDQGR